MELAQLLDQLRQAPEHRENFAAWHEIPPRPARYAAALAVYVWPLALIAAGADGVWNVIAVFIMAVAVKGYKMDDTR